MADLGCSALPLSHEEGCNDWLYISLCALHGCWREVGYCVVVMIEGLRGRVVVDPVVSGRAKQSRLLIFNS